MTAPPAPGKAPPAPRDLGPPSAQGRAIDRLAAWPWWAIVLVLAGLILGWHIATDATYNEIFRKIARGIPVTLAVTGIAYSLALVIGLVAGLGRLSKRPLVYNLATLYVQVIRGVPILVQLFFVAFVLTPALQSLLNTLGDLALVQGLLGADNALSAFQTRDIGFAARATFALAIAYGGFEAETFRAGIQSIERGQVEAARSLGLSRYHALRFVVLPQAIQRILPPLGNDLIAMLKDSSLVSVLGIPDITQQARLYASATFIYPETYYTLAYTYLVLTFSLTLVVKWLEDRMARGREEW